MNSKKIRKITLAVFAVALVALLAGCAVACDKETPQLTVNAELAFTYGDAPSEWTIVLDGAAEGDTAESLGIADDIVLPTAEEITSLGVGTYTFDVDVSGATASGYKLMGGVATLTVRPRALDVEVGSQEIAYSPDGARPYTDGTQATVSGLLDGHRIEIGLTADCEAVPNAGTVADILFDGTVKVYDGNEDVTDNYAVSVVLKEGAVMTVVKAKAGVVAVAEVDYDGNPHSFADSGYRVILPEGCDQEYTVTQADAKYTLGGIYSAAVVTLTETDNYVGQTVEGLLKIKSVKVGDTTYTLEDAAALPATEDAPVTAEMFGDTVINSDFTLPEYFTLVMREILDSDTEADSDISAKVGSPTYAKSSSIKAGSPDHVDGNASYIENTLTVPDGVVFKIEGNVIISGLLGWQGLKLEGHTSGKHSVLEVQGEAYVEDGGVLDIRGYVKGDGTLTLADGSKTYLPFVVYDFRGGTNSAITYRNGGIAPFNTYDLFYNLQADTAIRSNATVTSYLDLYASSNHNFASANLIASSDMSTDGDYSFFKMGAGSEIRISFVKEASSFNGVSVTGHNEVTLVGDIAIGDLSLKISLVDIKMSDVTLALQHRFDWHIGDGTTATEIIMPYNYKILPGAVIVVEENATLVFEKEVIIYSEFEDTLFAESVYPSDLPAGKLVVNGTLMLADGASFGGRIVSGNDGAQVVTGKDFNATVTSGEGNSGKSNEVYGTFELLLGKGDFVKVFEITETARFDEGILSVSTDTAKTFIHNNDTSRPYNYTERIRAYTSDNPLTAGTTYTYDAASGEWK